MARAAEKIVVDVTDDSDNNDIVISPPVSSDEEYIPEDEDFTADDEPMTMTTAGSNVKQKAANPGRPSTNVKQKANDKATGKVGAPMVKVGAPIVDKSKVNDNTSNDGPGNDGPETKPKTKRRKKKPTKYELYAYPDEPHDDFHRRRVREGMMKSAGFAHRRKEDEPPANKRKRIRSPSVDTLEEEPNMVTGNSDAAGIAQLIAQVKKLSETVAKLQKANDELKAEVRMLKNRNQSGAGCSSAKPQTPNGQPNQQKKPNEAAKLKTTGKKPAVPMKPVSESENKRIEQCIENALKGVIDKPINPRPQTKPAKPTTNGPSSAGPSTSHSSQATLAINGEMREPRKKKKKSKKSKKSKKPNATLQTQKSKADSTVETTTKLPSGPPKERPVWKKAEKPTTMLIVPTKAGTQVIEELEKVALDPSKLNIKKRKPFKSGALLLTCATKADKERVEQAVRRIEGITPQRKTPRQPEIRIHNIQNSASEEQVRRDIQRELGGSATEVFFVDYKKPLVRGTKLAVCKVEPSTYAAAVKRRTIHIGWRTCPLSTEVRVKRCDNCGLLGHPAKYCTAERPTGTAEGTQATTPANGCKDCHAFNHRLPKHLRPTRSRPTDHAAGSKKCPTLEFYRQKLLPTKPAGAAAPAAALVVSPGTSATTTKPIEKVLAAVTLNRLEGMDTQEQHG